MITDSSGPPVEAAYLTSGHEEWRDRVRGVLRRHVLPNAERWEALRRITRDGWRALAAEGLFGLARSGAGFLDSAILLEELGRTGYAGGRAAVGVHAYMAPSYIEFFGTQEQKDRYLPAVRGGEQIAALAINEDGAGSDLRHVRTLAVPDGPASYRVSGSKSYVANGSQAGFFVTLTRTGTDRPYAGPSRADPPRPGLIGASLLIIDASLPGVTWAPQPMLGWHAADMRRVEFHEVPVPADRLIGRPGWALLRLMRALDFERLVAGMLAAGGASHCVDLLDRLPEHTGSRTRR